MEVAIPQPAEAIGIFSFCRELVVFNCFILILLNSEPMEVAVSHKALRKRIFHLSGFIEKCKRVIELAVPLFAQR